MRKNLPTVFFYTVTALILGVILGVFWYRGNFFPFPQISAWRFKNRWRRSIESNPGRWRKINDTKSNKQLINKLMSIGYVSGSQPAPQKKGITIHEPSQTYNGLNLIVSGHAPEAILIDMEGNEIHKWSCDALRAWPDYTPPTFNAMGHTFWRRAHLFENGDLIAIFEGVGMIKLDKDSNLIWSTLNRAHHDLYITPNGHIYVLTREAHINKMFNAEKPILEDFVCILDSNGHELKKISIMKALKNSPYKTIMRRLQKEGDIFHTNTIEIIEEDRTSNPSEPFKKGRALISILRLDLVCVLDFEKETIVWAESDLWSEQHQPTMLENGNILVFDNKGFKGKSRVIEFNPITREIYWQYGGGRNDTFYSKTCGSNQRLPDGNTLITETDPGRAFEVTPEKTIVWEYVNPHRSGKNDELIASLFEAIRLKPDFPMDWLQ